MSREFVGGKSPRNTLPPGYDRLSRGIKPLENDKDTVVITPRYDTKPQTKGPVFFTDKFLEIDDLPVCIVRLASPVPSHPLDQALDLPTS